MNRINTLFKEKKENILSIYFTAGHPTLDSVPCIIRALDKYGADMIEIGMPFSDPMADGPVIQNSSSIALKNGMNLHLLFDQLQNIRKDVTIPILLMGYLNPVLQYGFGKFCRRCEETGVDGVILPDLPLEVFENNSLLNEDDQSQSIKVLFSRHNLHNVFLISPQTSSERIKKIDNISDGFIYLVSSSSTTGIKNSFSEEQKQYFNRIADMKLKNKSLVGFGISTKESFDTVCNYVSGAIIGSAFVKMLSDTKDIEGDVMKFIKGVKGKT